MGRTAPLGLAVPSDLTMKRCAPILQEIDYRTELPAFLNAHGMTGAGVEVGVHMATFSETILEKWKGLTLYLVDPYRRFTKAEYFDSTQDLDQEHVFLRAKEKLSRFGQRAQFMRQTGVEAAATFGDNSLDFVFIDSNHKYESSSAEIAAWFPKVRRGGLFCGHDFYTRKKDTDSDALNAVMDFAERIDTRPHVTWCNSWWFIKP